MKILFGILLILAGIVFGLYVGVYLMLFHGIMELVNCIQHTSTATPGQWAWAILRIFPLAELLGWLSFILFVIPGFGCFASSTVSSYRKW